MSLVIIDIECMENDIVKELGIYKNGIVEGYTFLPPKDFKPTKQSFWITKNLHGINWNNGKKPYSELAGLLKRTDSTSTEFFAKGLEKCRIISKILEKDVENLDNYFCPKVQHLIFKDEDYDWECSNYPGRHARTLHCAERKAFAYGTWTDAYFNNL